METFTISFSKHKSLSELRLLKFVVIFHKLRSPPRILQPASKLFRPEVFVQQSVHNILMFSTGFALIEIIHFIPRVLVPSFLLEALTLSCSFRYLCTVDFSIQPLARISMPPLGADDGVFSFLRCSW